MTATWRGWVMGRILGRGVRTCCRNPAGPPAGRRGGRYPAAMSEHYWLMKSEPEEVSVDDALAAPNATVAWTGVRNYQARNFMRDGMQIGDGVLFYHSSCAVPGIVGIARVAS